MIQPLLLIRLLKAYSGYAFVLAFMLQSSMTLLLGVAASALAIGLKRWNR